MSGLETLYGGQYTLLTQLIKSVNQYLTRSPQGGPKVSSSAKDNLNRHLRLILAVSELNCSSITVAL